METEIQNQGNKEKEEVTSTKVSQEPQNVEEAVSSHALEFDEWIKEKPRHNYIKLEPNESKVVRFKSGKPDEMLMSDFGGKLSEKKPVARYLVTTPEEPKEEQALDVTSKRLARDILAYYEKGFTELEITRLNTNPVSYRVIPVVARQQQKQMAVASSSVVSSTTSTAEK